MKHLYSRVAPQLPISAPLFISVLLLPLQYTHRAACPLPTASTISTVSRTQCLSSLAVVQVSDGPLRPLWPLTAARSVDDLPTGHSHADVYRSSSAVAVWKSSKLLPPRSTPPPQARSSPSKRMFRPKKVFPPSTTRPSSTLTDSISSSPMQASARGGATTLPSPMSRRSRRSCSL